MNKKLIVLALVFGLAGAVSQFTWADSCHGHGKDKSMNKMTKQLNLTKEQQDQIRAIKDEKMQKVEAAQTEAHEKIKAILTPEQQAKFDKKMKSCGPDCGCPACKK